MRGASSIKNDRSLVVAAGGDGTIREAATALVHSTVPLGVIPGGTANVLAQTLKVGSPTSALEAIRHGEPRSLDLGLARWSEKGATVERHFTVDWSRQYRADKTLIATRFPIAGCLAPYTKPIPPSPILASMR